MILFFRALLTLTVSMLLLGQTLSCLSPSLPLLGTSTMNPALKSTFASPVPKLELSLLEISFLLEQSNKPTSKRVRKLTSEQMDILHALESLELIFSEVLDTQESDQINQATLAFLRQNRYGNNSIPIEAMIWANFAGTVPQPLITAMTSPDHPQFKDLNRLIVISDNFIWRDSAASTGIDWPHMLAVIDIYSSSIGEKDMGDRLAPNAAEAYYDFAFSTGGDLLSFYAYTVFSADGKIDADATEKRLLSEYPSHYSRSDHLADMDGTLIARKLNYRRALLSRTIKDYYQWANLDDRELIYKLNFGGSRSFEQFINLFCEGDMTHFPSGQEDVTADFSGFTAFRSQLLNRFYGNKQPLTIDQRQMILQLFLKAIDAQ